MNLAKWVAIGACALPFLRIAPAAAGERSSQARSELQCYRQENILAWHFRNRPLLTYAFGSNHIKPYVRELFSLDGENVLRDAPADHLHHHGLMYAIGINGVNFWEEREQPGHQKHIELLAPESSTNARGLPLGRFTEVVHWVPGGAAARADTAAAAFLIEHRTLTLTVDEAQDEVALEWHAEFALGGRTNRVTLHGSDYNGLGLRLPAGWDRVARQENSERAAYPSGGKPGAVAGRWGSVSHPAANGRVAQVALFARPSGHAGTNRFFAMTEPFTYLSATQGLDQSPLQYRTGDRFRLDYLVLVYSRARSPAELEARFQTWSTRLK